MYEETLLKLQNFPSFRERSQRGVGLVKLALRSLNLEGKYERGEQFTWDEMIQFGIKFDGYRHAWTDVTKDYPECRGGDYDEKDSLVQEKQIELGYSPGYYQDVKKLAQI